VRDDDVSETNGLAQLIENGLEIQASAEDLNASLQYSHHPPAPRAADGADCSDPETDGGASGGGGERGVRRHV
jgi:hypothetical protein